MAGLFEPYAGNFDYFPSMGTSSMHEDSMHEDRGSVQLSYENDGIEHGTASTPGFLHIPHFPHKKMSPPPLGSR